MQKYIPDAFLNKIGDTYLIVNHDLSMMSVQIIDYYLFRFVFVFFHISVISKHCKLCGTVEEYIFTSFRYRIKRIKTLP